MEIGFFYKEKNPIFALVLFYRVNLGKWAKKHLGDIHGHWVKSQNS